MSRNLGIKNLGTRLFLLKSRARVAAIEDHKKGTARREPGNKMLMENIAVNLALLLEIYRTDSVQDSGGTVSGGITHLTAMSRVVEEVASSGLTD